ncbi:MAG: ribosomal RNA small subunit methyltransferase A [Firmicutes bacterium]|nr:ribosomal RNA small subunit methyltransferase A [Bacillota bacterium]
MVGSNKSNLKAKKSLGQNFLIDEVIINKIVNEVFSCKDDLIIEIGPGKGALTKKLKEKGCFVIAYEIDLDLKPYLDKLIDEKTTIIYQDILKSDLKKDLENKKYHHLNIVGNLPYYITTPIIEKIIEQELDFEKLVIMVQKEVADRFMASAGSKEYGYITLLLKHYFDVSKVCDVANTAFNPKPKVQSSVIVFKPRKDKIELDILKYKNFLKKCFQFKRKTLKNNLINYDWKIIKKVLNDHNLNEQVRAEELEEKVLLDIFYQLY